MLDMLRLDVLRLDMLLNMLLGRRTLRGLLGEVLRVLLLLLLLLRVLLDMLGMLDVLRHVLLLLGSVLRDGDRGLDRARVMLLLLLMMLGLGLSLGLSLSLGLGGLLSVWLGGGICPVVHGIVATVHVGLGILVLGAVTPSRRVSKRRLLLRLHRHRLLGLRRP